MRAGIAIPLLIAVGCIASASAAIAQTGIASTDDFEQCRREETMAELRLKACTAVIEDSSRIDEVRAEAFSIAEWRTRNWATHQQPLRIIRRASSSIPKPGSL